ncbi:MAG: Uma2 family endonuclease [Chloroflexi bacterium]|nr:Uma2 family endonuclease [Chloroflexota bacterium]
MAIPHIPLDHEAEFDDATNPTLLKQALGIELGPPAWPMRRPWNYERYCAIPEDGYRYEVIKGELYLAPDPYPTRSANVMPFGGFLDAFVREHDLGQVLTAPVNVVLADDVVVQPSGLFIQRDHSLMMGEAVAGTPDLMIEVQSSSTAALNRSRKADLYAEYGVPHYWIAAPITKSLELYELRDEKYIMVGRYAGDDTIESALFPGLSISLAAVWRVSLQQFRRHPMAMRKPREQSDIDNRETMVQRTPARTRRLKSAAAPLQPERSAWTYERYCAIPDDGYRYEVIKGELYVAPAPKIAHNDVVINFTLLFKPYIQIHNLGKLFIAPTDVILADGSVVQPDVLFVRRDRMDIVGADNVTGSPDLVIEVLSPSTAARDRGKKADLYAEHGVPHYWIAAPILKSLEVYELREGAYVLVGRYADDETFESILFPGLTISLVDIWR